MLYFTLSQEPFVLLINQQQEAVMLQLDQYGNLLAWSTASGHIIPPRTLRNGILVGGAQFHAPYYSTPDFNDPIWTGLVATSQSHLKNGEKFLHKLPAESASARGEHHFRFDGLPKFPWQYRSKIDARELPVNIGDFSYGLVYNLTTTRSGECTNERDMPYRAALQTYFSLKEKNLQFTVGGTTIVDETSFVPNDMLFCPLKKNLEDIQLKTGNRLISISCMGADHVMFCAHDLTQVCIELIYGEKHGKYLRLGESHQLMCGLIVTHD